MSLLYASRPLAREEKRAAVNKLLAETVPDRDFYILVAGAILLAVAGIFLDSIAVLIASMIVAPLAYPILGMSFGLISSNWRLLFRSTGMLVLSLLFSIAGAIVLTLLFGHLRVDAVFISFESNVYIATCIALVAGILAAYGLLRPKVGEAMTGIGVAVSLMPPLVATGIGLADPGSFPPLATFVIFLLNVAGIIIGSALVFLLI